MDGKLLDILKGFQENEWENYIEDILTLGLAYPISSLSEKDILLDIPFLLSHNNVPTQEYEKAICNLLNRFSGRQPHKKNLDRLLDVLVSLKSQRTKFALLKVFFDADLPDSLYLDVKIKALQALYRLNLEDYEKDAIEEKLRLTAFSLKEHLPVLFGNYLRFVRLQRSNSIFFLEISRLIEVNNIDNENLVKRFATVIFNKIEEAHYHSKETFFKDLYEWFIFIDIKVVEKKLFKLIIEKLIVFLDSQKIKQEVLSNPMSKQLKFIAPLSFSCDLLLSRKEKIDFYEISNWINNIVFFFENNGFGFLNTIFLANSQLIARFFSTYDGRKKEIFFTRSGETYPLKPPHEVFLLLDGIVNHAYSSARIEKGNLKSFADQQIEEILSLCDESSTSIS